MSTVLARTLREAINVPIVFTYHTKDVYKRQFYGISNENESIGPYLTDEDGNSMIPKIENGYYFFKDRQADKDKEILDRYSFNFTVAVSVSYTHLNLYRLM